MISNCLISNCLISKGTFRLQDFMSNFLYKHILRTNTPTYLIRTPSIYNVYFQSQRFLFQFAQPPF